MKYLTVSLIALAIITLNIHTTMADSYDAPVYGKGRYTPPITIVVPTTPPLTKKEKVILEATSNYVTAGGGSGYYYQIDPVKLAKYLASH